jgi:hypothetical protein
MRIDSQLSPEMKYRVGEAVEEPFSMDTRLVWGAVLVPIGHPEVFGGMWDSNQLHWTRAAAVAEIEEHVIKMGLLPLEWSRGEVQDVARADEVIE